MSVEDTKEAVSAGPEAVSAGLEAESALGGARYPIAPGTRVNVRSGPGTQYAVVRSLPAGSWVAIRCQTPGQTITGPYGRTNIWDNIGSGEFISDAYVKTGSDGYIAPRCA